MLNLSTVSLSYSQIIESMPGSFRSDRIAIYLIVFLIICVEILCGFLTVCNYKIFPFIILCLITSSFMIFQTPLTIFYMVLLVAGLSGINLDPSNLGINPAAKINPIHYLIVFIAIAWLLKSVIRKKFEIAKSSLNTPLLIFLFYVLVSLAWVPYLSADTILQLIRLLFAVLTYFFTISIINHKKALRQAMFFWWLGAVLSSLFVMLQFLGITSYGIYFFQQGVTRYAGLSKYTNNLSMYLNFSIVLGLAYFALVKSNKFKFLIMLGIILMFLGVLFSFTRAAWVGLAVGMLIFTLIVLNKEQKLRHRLYILFLFLTPALLFSSLMTDYGKKSYDLFKRLGSLQNIFEDPSLQSRLPIWEGGYEPALSNATATVDKLECDYIDTMNTTICDMGKNYLDPDE